MAEITLLKLFIVSPGDVAGERDCVKQVCDELNKSPLVKNALFHLEAVGWEDAVPRAGDPQEIMNRVLSSCNMVICIFHKRFGSPTAHHTSGTLDEFLFAYDNWKTKQSPYIALYFKTMNISSKAEFDDPQVKAVLEFKERVQRERLVLFKDFSGLPEFRVLVRQLLKDWISGLMNNEKIREKADEGNSMVEKTDTKADEAKGSGQKNDKKQSTTIVVQQDPVKVRKSGPVFTLLHISDLHIKKGEQFDQSVVFDPFLKRLEYDAKENNLRPDLVVVSGDLTWQGIKEEYTQVKEFFHHLLSVLHLKNEHIFFVPGNHDLDRKKYRPSDQPKYTDMKAMSDELANNVYRADLFKGLEEFFTFARQEYPHMIPVDENLVPFVHFPRTPLSFGVALVGLNSAWMCRKSPDREEIAIGEYQLKKALEKVKSGNDTRLIINLFHHPLEWLMSRDRKICRTYFHNSVCLVGHLHDAEGLLYEGYETRLCQFQAGGLYLGSESDWPCRYNYLSFDEGANTLSLDFRLFSKDNRRWIVDSDKGTDGKKVYRDFFFKQEVTPEAVTTSIETRVRRDALFARYLSCAYNEHCSLSAKGFNLKLPIQISQIYIKMRAFLHAASPKQGIGPGDVFEPEIMRMDSRQVDIKQAFTILQRNKVKDIVILGDPGAGKTTLLKYITISLIEGRGEEVLGISSMLIPFFGALRELKDPEHEDFRSFMARVCCFDERCVAPGDFKTLLEEGTALILLDGLDEVAAKEKRLAVIRWIEKAKSDYPLVHFIITSRLAGYTGVYRLDGNLLELVIDDFSEEEIHTFLCNWYRIVEGFLHGGDEEAEKKGEAEAEILYNEIVRSKRLKGFVKNPLLLQITALVHKDRGHLPERRVELYEECTTILLEKWDEAKGLNVAVRAREARKLLQPVAYWLHKEDERRSAPLEEIMEVLKGPSVKSEEPGKTVRRFYKI